MAEVGVHDDYIYVAGHGESGEDGGGEAAIVGPDFPADFGDFGVEVGENLGGGVGGVVVDDDDFPRPGAGAEGGGEGGEEFGEVVGFAVGGDDDADAGSGGGGFGHDLYLEVAAGLRSGETMTGAI